MVYKYIKKVSTVVSLVILMAILWSIYFLTIPRPSSSMDKVHSRFHVGYNNKSHSHSPLPVNHQSNISKKKQPNSLSTSHIQSLLNSEDLNFSEDDLFNRIKPDCRDTTCSEFLTSSDKPHFKYCVHKTWQVSVKAYQESVHSTCVFINGSNKYPIGLASYPGSGNTWVRGLLQKVTGLCIGGIYCDTELRQNGFPGESIRSGITFMVKSHQIDPRWEWAKYGPNDPFTYFEKREYIPVFSGGVFILRNPFHAMVSEFKRRSWERQPENHVKTLGKAHFGTDTKWDIFVHTEAVVWFMTVKGWLVNLRQDVPAAKKNPVIVVTYEDLLQNTQRELEKILRFVRVPYSSKQLHAIVSAGYKEYKRHHDAEFECYTASQKKYVNRFVTELNSSLKNSGYNTLDLTSYVQL